MRIGKSIIQNRFISHHTEHEFEATYKNRQIVVSNDHGFGKPDDESMNRYCITVYDVETGMYDFNGYEDHACLEKAIESALEGSLLLNK